MGSFYNHEKLVEFGPYFFFILSLQTEVKVVDFFVDKFLDLFKICFDLSESIMAVEVPLHSVNYFGSKCF